MKSNKDAYTFVEFLFVVAIISLLATVMSRLMKPIMAYFQQMKNSGQLTMNARVAMDSMTRLLREGVATTAVRCSCSGPAAPCKATCNPVSTAPFSHIDFTLQGNTTNYSIFWRTDNNTLEVDSTWPTGSSAATLASNVTGLTFNGTSQDPGVVMISLTLISPDKNNTVFVSSQTVHMIATP